MTPEEQARQEIDRLLTAAGWVVQNYRELNLSTNMTHLKAGRFAKMAFPLTYFLFLKMANEQARRPYRDEDKQWEAGSMVFRGWDCN